jgi:hypothetical protein
MSNVSLCTDDSDDDDEEEEEAEAGFQSAVDAPEDFVPSPLIPLKKQLELDKVLVALSLSLSLSLSLLLSDL